jgi:hypothetical protein
MNIRHLGPDVVERLTLDTEPWLSCDDCFRQVDEYVDRLLAGEADPMPPMRVHLRGCPACAEEAGTVLELAAEDAGVPAPDVDWT